MFEAEVIPLLEIEETSWQERALCAQTDPEAFFPEKGGSTREAKRVCGSCEVRVECLEYALANDERFGIWGGLRERERRRLKKRDFRALWIQRINAATRVHGLSYSVFMNKLKTNNINLDRKALAEIAYSDAEAFKAIVQKIK